MHGPLLEVEMKCIWEDSEWKVVVTSEGPYKDCKVNCNKKIRGAGVTMKGFVLGTVKNDANQYFCTSVNRMGKRDYSVLAFTELNGLPV